MVDRNVKVGREAVADKRPGPRLSPRVHCKHEHREIRGRALPKSRNGTKSGGVVKTSSDQYRKKLSTKEDHSDPTTQNPFWSLSIPPTHYGCTIPRDGIQRRQRNLNREETRQEMIPQWFRVGRRSRPLNSRRRTSLLISKHLGGGTKYV